MDSKTVFPDTQEQPGTWKQHARKAQFTPETAAGNSEELAGPPIQPGYHRFDAAGNCRKLPETPRNSLTRGLVSPTVSDNAYISASALDLEVLGCLLDLHLIGVSLRAIMAPEWLHDIVAIGISRAQSLSE